ncbi:SusC/RagA family TonB-linked outer membrane protein [Chitinophaga parva]|nr:SusC/RagA family TonB-linked outer membrane protein [Chitinophaga parva]
MALLMTTVVLLVSTSSQAQEKISLSFKQAPIGTVFKAIESQCKYRFWYDDSLLIGCKPVTIDIKDFSLDKALNLCFKDQPITFKIVHETIVVKSKSKTPAGLEDDLTGFVHGPEGPLEGASIRVRGTTNGTITDEKGFFILHHHGVGTVLQISAVGHESTEMVSTSRQLYITLPLSPKKLDESVVIAYGKVTRQANTAGLSQVTTDQLERQPVTNVLSALSANVPGLAITQGTGLPGAGFKVQIRGQSSLSSGTDPLYVVDGVPFPSTSLVASGTSGPVLPFSSPLAAINPADIESITVLKDADATAIYGSRGSNGVVMITTKKATEGSTSVDLGAFTGIGAITRSLQFLNTSQYLQMRHEAFANDGASPQPYDYDINGTFDTTCYTDWKKQLIGGHSSITNINGSVAGGSKQTQYLLSGGFIRETPPIPGNFRDDKGSAHLQASHSSLDGKLRSSISAMYLDETNHLPSTDPTALIANLPPDAPSIYDSTGALNWLGGAFMNPYAALKQPYQVHTSNLIATTTFDYRIFKGLRLQVDGGYNQMLVDELKLYPLSTFYPGYGLTSGSATYAHHSVKTWNLEPQLHYRRSIAGGLLHALAGATFQSTRDASESISATGFAGDALLGNIKAATTLNVDANDGYLYRYNAFFGRLSYDWQDKYMLSVSGRRDGSSRFGPGRRFANFGAVGAGWVFSKEAFASALAPAVSFGKIRGSYGLTGNDKIGDYVYLDAYQPTARPYLGGPGLYPVRLLNPDYSWETNKKLEVALELGFAKDRVYYTLSYYNNRSSNQLVGYALSAVSGFTSVQYNLPATIRNSGWEMELTSQNISGKYFSWKTSFNLTIPTNKLVAFPGLEGSSYATSYIIGKSLDTKPLYRSLGVDPTTGAYQFASAAGGQATLYPTYPADLVTSKRVGRSLYGGLENNLQYGGWSLVFLFQFVKQTGYNYLGTAFTAPGFYGNQPTEVLARWQHPGDHTTVQRFTQDYASDAYNSFSNAVYYGDNAISDASFIRLKNLVLSYSLSTPICERLHIKATRVFVQGQNLLTITGFKGMDPETQYMIYLPPLKVWTAGIKVTF